MWEYPEGNKERLRTTFFKRNYEQTSTALRELLPFSWCMSQSEDFGWNWEAEGLKLQRWQTDFPELKETRQTSIKKKKKPKEVPDHWKLANKIQELIFYSLQDSKAHLRQSAFSEQINTPARRKQRESKSYGKTRQVKPSSSQTLNKCWFSVDLNPYSSFDVNIY